MIRTRCKLGCNILLLAEKGQCKERSEETKIMDLIMNSNLLNDTDCYDIFTVYWSYLIR